MLKVIKIIFAEIFGIGLFPILVFLVMFIKRKKENVTNMHAAYGISLGYMGFILFCCMAAGYSFNGLKYFLSGTDPYYIIPIIAFTMFVIPFFPCFKNKKNTFILFFIISHLCIIMFFPLETLCSWKLRKFDLQKWKEVYYIRNEMVEDMRDTGLLEGSSADEIKNILGEPDKTEDFGDAAKYIYYSGNGSFITIYIEDGKFKEIFYIPSTGIGQH